MSDEDEKMEDFLKKSVSLLGQAMDLFSEAISIRNDDEDVNSHYSRRKNSDDSPKRNYSPIRTSPKRSYYSPQRNYSPIKNNSPIRNNNPMSYSYVNMPQNINIILNNTEPQPISTPVISNIQQQSVIPTTYVYVVPNNITNQVENNYVSIEPVVPAPINNDNDNNNNNNNNSLMYSVPDTNNFISQNFSIIPPIVSYSLIPNPINIESNINVPPPQDDNNQVPLISQAENNQQSIIPTDSISVLPFVQENYSILLPVAQENNGPILNQTNNG